MNYQQLSTFDALTISNKYIAITGRLRHMSRKVAAAMINECGGHFQTSVTRITDYLVVGNNSYHRTAEAGQSRKLIRARQLQKCGSSILLITEDEMIWLLRS